MGYVTSLFVRKMVAAAGPRVDATALLSLAGLVPNEPWDPKVMVPDTRYYDLIETIAAQIDATELPINTKGCDH